VSPRLQLRQNIIKRVAEARRQGASAATCAAYAGVSNKTLNRWLHYGEMLTDYLERGELPPPSEYSSWFADATIIRSKLERELSENGQRLTRAHKLYVSLWDAFVQSTTTVAMECLNTLRDAQCKSPDWALRGLRILYGGREYLDAPLQVQQDIRAQISGTVAISLDVRDAAGVMVGLVDPVTGMWQLSNETSGTTEVKTDASS